MKKNLLSKRLNAPKILFVFILCLVVSCSYYGELEHIRTMYNAKEYKAAISRLNAFIAEHPDGREGMWLRYRCYLALADYSNAMTDLRNLERLGDNTPGLYNDIGYVYFKSNQMDSARSNLFRAYGLDKATPQLNYNIAALYYNGGSPDTTALRYINTEIKLSPKDVQSRLLKSDILISLKEYSEALGQADTAILLDAQSADAYAKKGIAFFNMQNWQRAIEAYSKAISIESDNSDYYNKRGAAWYNSGNPAQCVKDLDKSIALDPNNYKAYALRVACNKKLNAPEQACADIEKIKSIKPDLDVTELNEGLNCKH